ncbi:hypothetical protein ACG9XL_19385, partial [Acinetobacter nosocomialis]
MKSKLLIAMTTLSISCFSFAETQPTSTNTALKPFSGVRVSMQRMLKSSEGRYFMNLYAGIAHPHG